MLVVCAVRNVCSRAVRMSNTMGKKRQHDAPDPHSPSEFIGFGLVRFNVGGRTESRGYLKSSTCQTNFLRIERLAATSSLTSFDVQGRIVSLTVCVPRR
jgi:hypothetical protein